MLATKLRRVQGDLEPIEGFVVDLDDRGSEWTETMRRLRRAHPEISVLGLASSAGSEALARGAALDTAGIYLKNLPSAELLGLARRVVAGETVPTAKETPGGGQGRQPRGVPSESELLLTHLTLRETNVLQALADGLSTARVGEELGISRFTVQSHVKSILAKLGVHSKIEAVSMGLRHGVVSIAGREADAEDSRSRMTGRSEGE